MLEPRVVAELQKAFSPPQQNSCKEAADALDVFLFSLLLYSACGHSPLRDLLWPPLTLDVAGTVEESAQNKVLTNPDLSFLSSDRFFDLQYTQQDHGRNILTFPPLVSGSVTFEGELC